AKMLPARTSDGKLAPATTSDSAPSMSDSKHPREPEEASRFLETADELPPLPPLARRRRAAGRQRSGGRALFFGLGFVSGGLTAALLLLLFQFLTTPDQVQPNQLTERSSGAVAEKGQVPA